MFNIKSLINSIFALPPPPRRSPQRQFASPLVNPQRSVRKRSTAAQLSSAHALMKQGDVVTIIGFGLTAGYVAAPSPLASPQLDTRVRELPARLVRLGDKAGRTNIAAALREALAVMRNQPPWRIRRVIVLSDGGDNREKSSVVPLVQELVSMHARVDVVAFGPDALTLRLEEIARAGKGRVLRAYDLRSLTAALQSAADRIPPRQNGGRLATIALLVDMSGSMHEGMPEEGGRRRIEVAVDALLAWLSYQRATFG